MYIFPLTAVQNNINPDINQYNWLNKKNVQYLTSSIIGIGTGLALMPIFNKELTSLKQFGIDIHANKTLFAISTINTLLIITPSSAIPVYKELFYEHKFNATPKQKLLFKIGVLLVTIPPLLQVSQLWNTEVHNQQVAKSHGFDEYMAWATFTTIPLMTTLTLQKIDSVRKFAYGVKKQYELDSIGSKIFVYSTSCLSTFGRAIAYTHAIKTLLDNIGFDEESSLAIGIIFGGIVGASIKGIIEYSNIKSLFSATNNEITTKNLIIGSICAIEGCWFSLPTISDGLEFAKDWQSFLQAAIFFPTFLSTMINDAILLYNNLQLKEHNEDYNYLCAIQQTDLVINNNTDDCDVFLVGNNNLLLENGQ